MKKMNKKGFTLIELLAVIVILGLLMAIAIPSVTRYITQSRKKTLASTIDQYITDVATNVNDNSWGALSDGSTLYLIPVSNMDWSCVKLEKGGSNPFGNWIDGQTFVGVHYNAKDFSYEYYFTFIDSAGYGMPLTLQKDINASKIVNPIKDITKDTIKTVQKLTLDSGVEEVEVKPVIYEYADSTCKEKVA